MAVPKAKGKSMKLHLAIAIVFPVLAAQAADVQSEFATGRSYHQDGNFEQAAVHFERALRADANSAELNYRAGMSYQRLRDIATPFGGKYSAKALVHLTKAVDLAPARADYRGELFGFLLDSAWSSPRTLRLAAAMLRDTRERGPEYDEMRRRFELEVRMNTSMGARLTRVTLAVPRIAERVAEYPLDRITSRENR